MDQLGSVRLPPTTHVDELFHINPVSLYIEDSRVIAAYKIPMVHMMNYAEFVFISIPDSSKHAIAFNGGAPNQKLVISRDNSSFFNTENAARLSRTIFDGIIPKPISPCLKAILNPDDTQKIQTICNIVPSTPMKENFFFVGEDWAIVSTLKPEKVEISCPEGTFNLTTITSLVHFPGCTIKNGNISVTSAQNVTSAIETQPLVGTDGSTIIPIRKTELFHFDPSIQLMREELQELSKSYDWIYTDWRAHTAAGSTVTLIAAAAILGRSLDKC